MRKEAAALLGVTPPALGDWVKEPWFPADGKTPAGWNVTAIRTARDAMGRKGSEQSDQAKRIKLAREAEKLKQDQIKTRKETLKLKEQEGELLPRRGWELFAAELLTAFTDWCDQLPDLIAAGEPKKGRKRLKQRLKAEFDLKRRELRDELERKAKELDGRSRESSDES